MDVLVRIVLAPILYLQAWWVFRRMPHLSPATGPDHGTVEGAEPQLRVVVIGESTAVGVGAVVHTEALPGFIAEALRGRLSTAVAWSVYGRKGATVRRLVDDIVPAVEADADVVFVVVGINDLIRQRTLRQWHADVAELLGLLHDRWPDARLVISGIPPVGRFPSLPQPLRAVLGARARAMDDAIRTAAQDAGASHVAMDQLAPDDPRHFAGDGFHPSPTGYRVWANGLARVVPPSPDRRPPAGYPG